MKIALGLTTALLTLAVGCGTHPSSNDGTNTQGGANAANQIDNSQAKGKTPVTPVKTPVKGQQPAPAPVKPAPAPAPAPGKTPTPTPAPGKTPTPTPVKTPVQSTQQGTQQSTPVQAPSKTPIQTPSKTPVQQGNQTAQQGNQSAQQGNQSAPVQQGTVSQTGAQGNQAGVQQGTAADRAQQMIAAEGRDGFLSTLDQRISALESAVRNNTSYNSLEDQVKAVRSDFDSLKAEDDATKFQSDAGVLLDKIEKLEAQVAQH